MSSVRPKMSSVPAARWALKGYQRTAVIPVGASATVAFVVPARELATVLADGSRTVTPGAYTIAVGGGNPRDPRVTKPAAVT